MNDIFHGQQIVTEMEKDVNYTQVPSGTIKSPWLLQQDMEKRVCPASAASMNSNPFLWLLEPRTEFGSDMEKPVLPGSTESAKSNRFLWLLEARTGFEAEDEKIFTAGEEFYFLTHMEKS